jgi:hypothetical protein
MEGLRALHAKVSPLTGWSAGGFDLASWHPGIHHDDLQAIILSVAKP